MKGTWVSLLIASGVAATIVADMFLKKGEALTSRSVAVGAVLYALVAIPVTLAYRQVSFSALFIIWEGATILVGLVVGMWWFGEALTVRTVVAASLAIIAMILIYSQ